MQIAPSSPFEFPNSKSSQPLCLLLDSGPSIRWNISLSMLEPVRPTLRKRTCNYSESHHSLLDIEKSSLLVAKRPLVLDFCLTSRKSWTIPSLRRIKSLQNLVKVTKNSSQAHSMGPSHVRIRAKIVTKPGENHEKISPGADPMGPPKNRKSLQILLKIMKNNPQGASQI